LTGAAPSASYIEEGSMEIRIRCPAAASLLAVGLFLFGTWAALADFPAAPAPTTFWQPSPLIAPGTRIQLPILGYVGDSGLGVETTIEVQNVGDGPTQVTMLLWGQYSGACEPQAPGPGKTECSGVLQPGSSWIWTEQQLPSWARTAILYSTASCISPASRVAIAAEVVRKALAEPDHSHNMVAAYSGISDLMEGRFDSIYGGYAYYAPIVFANHNGFNSWIYVQNSGTACTSLEVWLKAQEECSRAQICEVLALAPGETYALDVSRCVGAGFQGSVWVRGSQPLGIVVDQVGHDMLMSYTGHPAEQRYQFDSQPEFTVGSEVAFGPLIYREFNGWDSIVYVQNMSSIYDAKVKVYFLDLSGNVIRTLTNWVCPRGSQSFFLPVIDGLPGHYVGSIRVESLAWWSPGSEAAPPPNITAVAELIRYDGPARQTYLEAMAYNLFPEHQVMDWQVGQQVNWGQGLIGIPSLNKGGAWISSELAILNAVPVPGLTDFVIYVYDQNGLVGHVCQKLAEKQVEYLNLETWGFLNARFRGSAVISATQWHHPVHDAQGRFLRNAVGLAAIKIERSDTTLSYDIPGDESGASEGFPLPASFRFAGPIPSDCGP
jgi:hypothetical protein